MEIVTEMRDKGYDIDIEEVKKINEKLSEPGQLTQMVIDEMNAQIERQADKVKEYEQKRKQDEAAKIQRAQNAWKAKELVSSTPTASQLNWKEDRRKAGEKETQ